MRIRLFLVSVFVILVVALSGPLQAHTEVWERSPESGLAYGGTIDQLEISFFASVSSSEITIVDPTGENVPVGPTRLAPGDRVAIVEFPALTEPGAYVVTHTELAADGDFQTDTFQFFYDPESPNEVESLIVDDGPNWVLLAIITGVVLVLGGFFWPGRSSER